MNPLPFLKRVLTDSITGPNGSFDPVRILFGIGGTNGIVAPIAFQAWAMIDKGGAAWDVGTFCASYGAMLSAVVLAGGTAMGFKDKGLAQAQATIADTNIRKAASEEKANG